MVGTAHPFCPAVCFSLPDPNFCCHILSSVFILYNSREQCHLSLSAAVFRAFMAESHFSSLSNCCAQPSSLMTVAYGHPRPSGGLFHLLPFLVLHGSLLSSVGFCLFVWGFFVLFFSLDFKIPSTAKALPPCVPSVFCVL